MANSEDYLDGLLESITKAKSDSKEAANEKLRQREARIASRNRIKPTDDFMAATGIDSYEPKTMSRKNLRAAFSEDSFLRDFEAELASGEADDFIRDFEREIIEEEEAFAAGEEIVETNSLVNEILEEEREAEEYTEAEESSEAEEISNPEEISEAVSDEDDFDLAELMGVSEDDSDSAAEDGDDLDDFFASVSDDIDESVEDVVSEEGQSVADILSGAMAAMDDDEPIDEAYEETTDDEINPEDLLQEEFAPDDLDLADEIMSENGAFESPSDSDEAEDESDEAEDDFGLDLGDFDSEEPMDDLDEIIDENSEDVDLMSMLEGEDGDLSDIGDLLSADEEGAELDEAREEFESSANSLGEDNSISNEDNAASASDGKKMGLLGKIKAFFAGFLEDDEEEDGTVEIHDGVSLDDTSQENADLMAEFDSEENAVDAEDPKAKKKREKEEAKKAKEAEAKEKKAAKDAAKKEAAAKKAEAKAAKEAAKVPDNSPKIPMKVIIVCLILAVSIIAAVILATKLLGYQKSLSTAKSAYEKGSYVEAFRDLDGLTLEEDDMVLYEQAKLLATLELKLNGYQTFMDNKQYEMALDQLVLAYGAYRDNSSTAAELGVADSYDSLGAEIEQQLVSQFNVPGDTAYQLYSMEDREDYTWTIRYILETLGISVEEE